ncbi:MAG: hypothetical protein RBR50_11100 [Candidatus Izemoplasmatales bacterium]|nr:hypothetical protein [Candidatus Izemoplasmatales bacterium]
MSQREKKKAKLKVIITILTIISNALIYYLTFNNGGIHSMYSQLMYIPVLLSGFYLGTKAGMLSALFSAMLLGPIMPVNITFYDSKEFTFWIIRLVALVISGLLSGYLMDRYRYNKRMVRTYKMLYDTQYKKYNI